MEGASIISEGGGIGLTHADGVEGSQDRRCCRVVVEPGESRRTMYVCVLVIINTVKKR